MGMIQQGFNQALTGATFLLQQTPQWKAGAEGQQAVRDVNKMSNSAFNISETLPKKLTPENQKTAGHRLGQLKETIKNIDTKVMQNPYVYEKKGKDWPNTYSSLMEKIDGLESSLQNGEPPILGGKQDWSEGFWESMAAIAKEQYRIRMQDQNLAQYKEWLKSQPKTVAKEEMNPNNASLRSGMAPRMD